ncbi:MAG TPA: hypothetical protein VMR97_03865 [Acidimicrobiales bacterium]|nr:hypothetical protein [Acidimicrobiales bacterium]
MTTDDVVAARRLIVVAADAEALEDFELLVADVAGALDLVPAPELFDREEGGETAMGRLLARASSAAGPLLVLPVGGGHAGAPGGARKRGALRARMRRVLVSSDASEEVAAATRSLHRRFTRAGVHLRMLHVMTADNTPRMWDGPGHHAAAWLDELRRRHGASPEAMSVVGGQPAEQLHEHAGEADLVVLFWRRDSREGHAAVIRSLFARGIEVPKLLVPLEWMDGHPPPRRLPGATAASR